MTGFPGVSLVDAAGHQIGASATNDTSEVPVEVKLAPQDFTSIVLHTNIGPNATCGPTSTAVKITPPGDSGAFMVTLELEVCGPLFTTTVVGTTT